jgi:hypothetical protein
LKLLSLKYLERDTSKEARMEDLEKKIQELKKKLTGNLWEDMDTKGKIHNLEMKLKGVRPIDSQIECIGCGS